MPIKTIRKKIKVDVHSKKPYLNREYVGFFDAFFPSLFALISLFPAFVVVGIILFFLTKKRAIKYNYAQSLAIFGFFFLLVVFSLVLNIFLALVLSSDVTELLKILNSSIPLTFVILVVLYALINFLVIYRIIVLKDYIVKYPIITPLINRFIKIRE